MGVVGLLDDVTRRVAPAFRGPGDVVGVLGALQPGLGGSAYAELAGSEPDDRPPAIDLEAHRALLALLVDAARDGLLLSAQDVSGGGLAVASPSAASGGRGGGPAARVGRPARDGAVREGPGRVVVSASPEGWSRLVSLAGGRGVPIERLGETAGDRLCIQLAGAGAIGLLEERGSARVDLLDAAVGVLREAWLAGLPHALGDDDWRATPGTTGPTSAIERGQPV
ncbi:MAG: AIR synthase-related protein [Chloroflexota bacterium]